MIPVCIIECDQILYREWVTGKDTNPQAMVPFNERRSVLAQYRDNEPSGHLSVSKTLSKISQVYFWPGLQADARAYIAGCDKCSRRKGTNCAPLLVDLFLYSYWTEFVQKLLRVNSKKLAVSFNHTFRYINDVLSIKNHNFHNYVKLINPDELEIKDTTKSDKSAAYLDNCILHNIDSNGKLTTSLYDKHDDFDCNRELSLSI
jgi:hypothetical protein